MAQGGNMSTATFTVPLTARVLRAILADMEGTEGLLASECCAGKSCESGVTEPTRHQIVCDEEPQTYGEYLADTAAMPLTSGIVEQGNQFAVPTAIPTSLDGVPIDPEFFPFGAEPTTPFILTPDGVIPTAGVTDPFIGQATTLPAFPMPPATVTPPAPPVAGPPLDGEGLPWDKRIHASTKTKRIGDNTWKLARGIDAETVERVKAELRATMSAGTVAPAPPTVPALSGSYVAPNYSGAPVPPTIAAVETVPTTTVPQPPSVTVVAPPPVPAAPEPPAVFSEFVTWVTGKLVAKEFSRDQLQAACAAEGITSMPMLENRPDLVPAIWKFLESICIPATSIGGV